MLFLEGFARNAGIALLAALACAAAPRALAEGGGAPPAVPPSPAPAGDIDHPTAADRLCQQKLFAASRIPRASSLGMDIRTICAERPSQEEQSCMRRYFGGHEYFRFNPRDAYRICGDDGAESRACFDDLTRRHLLPQARIRFSVCDTRDDSQRRCMVDTLVAHDNVYFNDLRQACELPAGGGRDCVIGKITSPARMDVNDAKDICQFWSPDTRECMQDYYSGSGGFAQMARLDHFTAEEICRISHHVTRECALKNIKTRFLPSDEQNIQICLLAGSERESCLRVLEDYGIGNWVERDKICGIPNFETRACVISKLLDRLHHPSFWDFGSRPNPSSFLYSCAGEAAGAITGKALDAFEKELVCRFAPR